MAYNVVVIEIGYKSKVRKNIGHLTANRKGYMVNFKGSLLIDGWIFFIRHHNTLYLAIDQPKMFYTDLWFKIISKPHYSGHSTTHSK